LFSKSTYVSRAGYTSLLWIEKPFHCKMPSWMSDSPPQPNKERQYPTGELVRRLLGLAWQFRGDCLLSLTLSVILLLLGLAGLHLLGVIIDVIRHALDASQRAPSYPFGWNPPTTWTPLHIVTGLSLAIVAQAALRAVLTYQYNMTTA